DALPKSRDRGIEWFKTVKEDKSKDLNEQLVVRLLVARTYGDPEQVKQRIDDLTARQNADGGWTASPKLNQSSDAFATVKSLLALAPSGTSIDYPATKKGRDYLLQTQRDDGSWEVLTPTFHASTGRTGRDLNTDEVYTYWGTAWSALGLLHALPP